MSKNENTKHDRILSLCMKFRDGEIINKEAEAEYYGVHLRSIQRDIDDLRNFFSNQDGMTQEIIYDYKARGYRLISSEGSNLTNGEALAVCKILLESRAFAKTELMPILDKILRGCVPKSNFQKVSQLIANEKHHYIEPYHRAEFVDKLWEIGIAVQEQRFMKIQYTRTKDKATIERLIKPVGIMFSEYYFYLTAFLEGVDRETEFDSKDDIFPTIYRIDRIKEFDVLDEHFAVPYKDRFEEGEFRKRVQFMYGGRLQRIKFQYSGQSVDAVLDRLPTAKIINEQDGMFTITAEVFGKGIDMWLRSQGDNIQIID